MFPLLLKFDKNSFILVVHNNIFLIPSKQSRCTIKMGFNVILRKLLMSSCDNDSVPILNEIMRARFITQRREI